MSITENQRLIYIDFLKVVAIIFVITLHAGLWHTNFINDRSGSAALQYFFRIIAEGVPVFVMVNGFLLLSNNFELRKHIQKLKNY